MDEDRFARKAVKVKYVVPSLILALAGGGISVWLFADSLLPGLGLTALALVLWGLTPGALGQPGGSTGSAGSADPRRVREYRSGNPGATIADGIRATRS